MTATSLLLEAIDRQLDPVTVEYLDRSGRDYAEVLAMLIPERDYGPLQRQLNDERGERVSREDTIRHALARRT